MCMPRVLTAVLLFSFAATASPARAQSAQSTMIGGCRVAELSSIEQQSDKVKTPEGVEENVSTALRSVRVDCDGMQFFAERMQVFHDRGRVVASGNVLFISAGHRISADRMDFDTKTRTGSFFEAHGVVSLGERADRSLFGTQEPDATFWGNEVQKLGPEKYRIIDGGFTTCAQPTPRWDVASGSVTLNLDDYALLVNSVFRVKGVPILYLPVFYYPIQEDDRATGFLIPTYGTSTVRGQTLSNAFFWAMGRSHDATFLHDWFSKTGQGYGGEYRYELGGGSQGNTRIYVINEKETTFVDSTGQEVTQPARAVVPGHGWPDAGARRWLPCPRQRRLLLRHRHPAALSAEHLPGDEQPARIRRQHHRQLGRIRIEWNARSYGLFLPGQHGNDARRSAANHGEPRREADRAFAVVFRCQRRIRDVPAQHGTRRCDHERSGPDATGFQSDTADSFHAMAVPHGELGRRLARNVLDREQESADQPECARRNRPAVLRLLHAHHRSGVPQDLRPYRRRLRREVQAHRRADAFPSANHRDRRVQPDRPARRQRLCRRERDARQLRSEQPAVCEKGSLARDPQPDPGTDLLHGSGCGAVRSELPEQLQRCACVEVLSDVGAGAHLAHGPYPGRVPDGVQTSSSTPSGRTPRLGT